MSQYNHVVEILNIDLTKTSLYLEKRVMGVDNRVKFSSFIVGSPVDNS